MNESISGRVGRILTGSLNSLIDAIENAAPDAVLDQSMREIDQAVSDIRAELGKVIARRHLTAKRMAEKNHIHEELNDKIALAVKEKRDDLAEAAIERQLNIEAQIPVMEQAIRDCSEEEKSLEGYISALTAKRREMDDEVRALKQTAKASQAATNHGNGFEDGATAIEERVRKSVTAFDRVLEQKTGIAASSDETLDNASSLAELEKMALKNRVNDRLAAFKATNANQY